MPSGGKASSIINVGGGDSPFAGAPSNILVSNDDTATTTVTGDPFAFVTASLTTPLLSPKGGYDDDFVSGNPTQAVIEHTNNSASDYRIDFSGTIISDDPAFLGTYIGIRVISDSGQEFTGAVRFYPVGVTFAGSSPAIGFSALVFGNIGPGEQVSLQLSSNTAGDLLLTDVIMFAVRISPAGG